MNGTASGFSEYFPPERDLRDRVAGTGGGMATVGRSRAYARAARRRAATLRLAARTPAGSACLAAFGPPSAVVRVSLSRRRACQLVAAPRSAMVPAVADHWPRPSRRRACGRRRNTRGSSWNRRAPIAHQMLAIKNPSRLVLDLEDVEMTSEIEQLPRLVHPERSIHPVDPRRTLQARRAAPCTRSQDRGEPAAVRACSRLATTAIASCSTCIR